jgi:alpha-2-macroglobulin
LPPTPLSLQEPVPPVVSGPPLLVDDKLAERAPPSLPAPSAPVVLEVGPHGAVDVNAEPHVRFDRALAPVGEALLADPPMEIVLDPKVAGRTRWRTPELLVFEAEAPLSPAHRYQVRVEARKGANLDLGQLLSDPRLHWSFDTPALAIEGSYPTAGGEQPEDWDSHHPVLLRFNQPVALEQLRRALSVHLLRGEPRQVQVEIRPTTPEQMANHAWAWDVLEGRWREDLAGRLFLVRPKTAWPSERTLSVEVAVSLVGKLGPLSMAAPWRLDIKTPKPPAVESVKAVEGSCADSEFLVRFTENIPASQRHKVTVTPRPPGTKVELRDAWDAVGAEVALVGPFVPTKRYTVRVDASLRDVHGYRLGEGNQGRPWSQQVSLAGSPSLRVSGTGIFPADENPRFGVTTRWVRRLRVTAALLSPEQAQRRLFPPEGEKSVPDFDGLDVSASQRQVREYPLTVEAPTYYSDLALDLRDLVGDHLGTVLVEVQAVELVDAPKDQPSFVLPDPAWLSLRRTGLAAVAFHSPARSIIQVVRLADGVPAANLAVEQLLGSERRSVGSTDPQGLLLLPWSREHPAPRDATFLIVDGAARDQALVHMEPWQARHHAGPPDKETSPSEEKLLVDFTLDRNSFRPGETISLVGFALVETPYAATSLRLPQAGSQLRVQVRDAGETVVVDQPLTIDRHGKLWGRLPLPKSAKLGLLRIEVSSPEGPAATKIAHLEDFRVPELELRAQISPSAIVLGEKARLTVDGRLFSGGPVPLRSLSYAVNCSPEPYPIPYLDEAWVVGSMGRHWRQAFAQVAIDPKAAQGHFELSPELPAEDFDGGDCAIEIQATDDSRRAEGARARLWVHPASFYLAVRVPKHAHAGDSGAVLVRALDPAGTRRAVKGVRVHIAREERVRVTKNIDGRLRERWEDRKVAVRDCPLDLEVEQDARCSAGRLEVGRYQVEASASDGERRAVTPVSFYVEPRPRNRSADRPASSTPQHLEATLVRADAPSDHSDPWRVGERLRLEIKSPCASGRGLALLERAGVQEQHPFLLTDHRANLDLTVADSWIPQVEIEVMTLCKEPGQDAKVEHESQRLAVSPNSRELKVEVEVPKTRGPSQPLPISVAVRSSAGQPLTQGQVAVWVVDEAVLSLTGYQAQHPLHELLPRRGRETTFGHELSALLHAYAPVAKDPLLVKGQCLGGLGGLGTIGHGGGSGSGSGYGAGRPTPARTLFETTPIFIGDAELDPKGRAHFEGRLPDNLTSFRVTALASAALTDGTTGRFGLGESSTVVSSPFFVRPALPRQLRPGDQAEIAAIVQSQHPADGQTEVQVRVTAGDALVISGPQRRTLELPSGGQIRVPFQVKAQRPGQVELELRARLTDGDGRVLEDAVRLPVPVAVEPTLVERAAHYGTLDDDRPVALAAQLPAQVSAQFGGLSLDVSSSLLGELKDAVQYLMDYPYGCIEQTSSRVLSLAIARQLGQHFGLDQGEIERRLQAGLERMASMQTESGGFAYWPEETTVHPYASGFATWVLLQAQQAGAQVPPPTLARALDYLAAWVEQGSGVVRTGRFFGDPKVLFPTEQAMALFALAQAGRPLPSAAVEQLLASQDDLPTFGWALFSAALGRVGDGRAVTMTDRLLGRVSELPGVAHAREAETSRWDYLFHSPGRSDAAALFSLLVVRPEHPVVGKLARGLLEARRGGRWRNTQENAFSLLALLAYARRFEAARPDLAVDAWVEERPILQKHLTPSFPGAGVFVPMAKLVGQPQPIPVVLQRHGQGRLYYRLGTEWADARSEPPPREQGLLIERGIHAVGSKPISAGMAVELSVTLKNRSPLSYVAVELPVPGGLEPVLENLGRGHRASHIGPKVSGTSYEERRPDRVRLFFDQLNAGVHHLSIPLRAITPGDFALPPASAEAMYMPEVYGRTGGGRLTVLAP